MRAVSTDSEPELGNRLPGHRVPNRSANDKRAREGHRVFLVIWLYHQRLILKTIGVNREFELLFRGIRPENHARGIGTAPKIDFRDGRPAAMRK